MYQEIKDAIKVLSQVFPISFAYTDSSYNFVDNATSGVKKIVCNNNNHHDHMLYAAPKMVMEMAQICTDENKTLDVIKITSNTGYSQRKYSLFIDISNLRVKSLQKSEEPSEILDQSRFHSIFAQLSRREKEILEELSLMKTSEEIGRKLFISPFTVSNHRKRIKQKSGFASRDEYGRFLNWVRKQVCIN